MIVADLDFGVIKVGTATSSAAAITSGSKTRKNMVSFGDVSGDHTSYTIYDELIRQFINGMTTLDKATIDFINPTISMSGEGTITASGQTMRQSLGYKASIGGGFKTFIAPMSTEASGK